MAISVKDRQNKYSYKDYMSFPDSERWELFEGKPFAMTPGPSRVHQKVSGALFYQFYDYLKGNDCEVYSAPFDVRLSESYANPEEIYTVVQPDISVICDKSKLDDRGCSGAPDLIVEIVSPSSISMDYVKKLNLYWKHGVKEYWIVDPIDKSVLIYTLSSEGDYGKPTLYSANDKVNVGIFKELIIDLKKIFECI